MVDKSLEALNVAAVVPANAVILTATKVTLYTTIQVAATSARRRTRRPSCQADHERECSNDSSQRRREPIDSSPCFFCHLYPR